MTQKQNPVEAIETIVISDFSGRLTRVVNGQMNSGYAKFATSFGYDPFTKPRNLTWFEQPASIGGGLVTDLILDAQTHNENGQTYIYAIGNAGKFYRIQPNSTTNANLDSVVGVTSIISNSPSFDYGASLEFFGAVEKAYISSDNQINSASIAGSFGTGDTLVANSNIKTGIYHPLRQLFGKLLFGNGNTIGAISATNTVTSSVIGTGQGNLYSEINPPLPVQVYVRDIDTTQEGNYALLTASATAGEAIDVFPLNDVVNAAGSDGFLFKWNGTDQGTTSFATIPSYSVTALQTYLDKNYFFSNDSFGAALSDGSNKLLTLENNKAPLPNATLMNGNFVVWMTPEVAPNSSALVVGSMYYFGSLDQENPSGLYRVLRYAPSTAGASVYQVPTNILTNNKYRALDASASSIISVGYGKHYFSTMNVGGGPTTYTFQRFLVTSTGTGVPQAGVYETQTQLFSNKIAVKAVRVYTEPTTTGNGFQIDYIGSDGSVISNSTSTYSYSAGTDQTLLQGPQDRINFAPEVAPTYALGIRITNTGTTNMVIKKIEVDYVIAGV